MTTKFYIHSRKIWMFICILEIPILYFSGLSNRAPDSRYSLEAQKAVINNFKLMDEKANELHLKKVEALLEAEAMLKVYKL